MARSLGLGRCATRSKLALFLFSSTSLYKNPHVKLSTANLKGFYGSRTEDLLWNTMRNCTYGQKPQGVFVQYACVNLWKAEIKYSCRKKSAENYEYQAALTKDL